MMDYQPPPTFTMPSLANSLHLKDAALNASGDESVFPASTLSAHSDYDSSSDITSLLLTARSASPTNVLEESGFGLSTSHTGAFGEVENWTKHDTFPNLPRNNSTSPNNLDIQVTSQPTNFFLEQSSTLFMPIPVESVHSQRSRTPSPGISKMLLSLSVHPVERPCTPNASTLYRNTKTHCNPSELGQQTYDECMLFTRWANSFLTLSRDQFLITDLARDLGDGLTLLSLVEMLVGEYPPQIHVKPALDVQKMENVQTCLDFLEYCDVSVNGIAAEDIVNGNLKVVLALCHCLYRHFGSNTEEKPRVDPLTEKGDLALFDWVSEITDRKVTSFQSFQDGTVLCLLLNKILEDAIPNLVLEYGSPAEKVGLALKVSSDYLGISTSLQTDDIVNQRNGEKFIEYLKLLYLAHSSKTKRVHDALEQSSFQREMKRLQLREQRLKERQGSQLTYLGELRQNKSHIAREKLQLSLANPSRVVPNTESLDNKRQEFGELAHDSSISKVTAQNGTLNLKYTKRQLDELEKELRLLKLECEGESYGYGHESTDHPEQLSFQGDSLSFVASNGQRRKTNPKKELRDVYRGSSTSARLGKKSDVTGGSSDLTAAAPRCETFESGSDDGKLPFGGCYLSEPRGGFDTCKSERCGQKPSFDESFVFKEYPTQSSFLEEARTFTPHTSSQTIVTPKSDTEQISLRGEPRTFSTHRSSPFVVNSKRDAENGHGVLPKSPLETKGVSSLFDIDFRDLIARTSPDLKNTALKRMVRAANRSKIDRHGLHAGLLANRDTANVNDEMATPLQSSSTEQDKGGRLGIVDRRLNHGLGPPQSTELCGTNVNGEMSKSLRSSSTEQDNRERLGTTDRRFGHGLNAARSTNRNETNDYGEISTPFLSSSTEQDNRERLSMFDRRPRCELGPVLVDSPGRQTNVNGKATKPLPRSSTKQDKDGDVGVSLTFVPSSRPVFYDKGISCSRDTPSADSSATWFPGGGKKRDPGNEVDSSAPARQLQRSLSNEKRHREKVLAKKSARNVQPSSTKTHLHALTASIRTSAKNAGASCSEEDE